MWGVCYGYLLRLKSFFTDSLLHDKLTASLALLIVRLHLSGPKLIFFLVLSEGGPVVCDLVPPKVPLVLDHLAALLTAHLTTSAVHV